MNGTIAQVKDSQSGKTLSVKVGDQWYTSKNWEFRDMIGKDITFEPTSSEWQGNTMWWINEYQESGAALGPADQAMQQAMQNNPAPAQPPTQQPTQQPVVDRDASIVAQALTKSVTCANAQEAWETYTMLYAKYKQWDGVYRSGKTAQPAAPTTGVPPTADNAQAPYNDEFLDSIPF